MGIMDIILNMQRYSTEVLAYKLDAEFAAAMVDACTSVVSGYAEMFACLNAYARAEKVKPQWVHFAKYHKKKRIRKKYHNRIMREFGGDR